ncbi:MAG: hypothetical protein H8E90_02755 [Anaerolineales bacterium]|nr:hypothetical protein [Anaerolineales bacterium]
MTLRLCSGQACHGYGAAALQNGVLEPDFIGRELCSTATSWPCGLVVVSPFGVAGLTVPKYDIEFRGLTESGVVNSMNPLNSLSYLPNSHLATLNRKTTGLGKDN